MCSIQGFIRHDDKHGRPNAAAANTLRSIIEAAEDRGRDSVGVVGYTPGFHSPARGRAIGPPSTSLDGRFDAPLSCRVAISNTRAEPTTEYVERKRLADVQPFDDGNMVVTHNGTIANDGELREELGVETQTDIDTAVLPPLLSAEWDGRSLEGLASVLDERVVGSFALGIINMARPNELYLATNYKPLSLVYDSKEAVTYFASLREYLPGAGADLHETRWQSFELPTYSVARVSADGLETAPLPSAVPPASRASPPRSLVVASGGLDSTVVASMLAAQGRDVGLIHFRYRCRAEEREVRAVREVAERLGVPLEVVDLGNLFSEVIQGSPLTEVDPEIADGESGAEFAHEWVPARNLVMLSLAVAYAEAHGYDTVASGINLEEAGAYPDNEMEFVNRVAATLPYATSADAHVEIEMPVGNLMKHEIVAEGLEVDAPLDVCWSCYNAGEHHCGSCGPCFMRQTAFEINDAEEVIPYAQQPEP